MIIEPMIINNICLNAHPLGCELSIERQIDYARGKPKIDGPKRVLVIGASSGYGMASLISSAYSCSARTVGVSFELPAKRKRSATVGWYNLETFQRAIQRDGQPETCQIIGDAFSDDIRRQTCAKIKEHLGAVDLLVYSIASGQRIDPKTGVTHRSVIKPIGEPFNSVTLDPFDRKLMDVSVQPATEKEIEDTVATMGGCDWELWVNELLQNNLVAPGMITVAYSYIGPELTHPIYHTGTIGNAKRHLEKTARSLTEKLHSLDGKALLSVNKALVTRASSVIPVVPLYLTILFKEMKRLGLHEGCIEQMYRLFADRLYSKKRVETGQFELDEEGRIRMDDWEMRPEVQKSVAKSGEGLNADNIEERLDIDGFISEFMQMHGFGYPSIDYTKDVDI